MIINKVTTEQVKDGKIDLPIVDYDVFLTQDEALEAFWDYMQKKGSVLPKKPKRYMAALADGLAFHLTTKEKVV